MAVASFILPRFKAIDDFGRPMVGAMLYTYQNNTTTPAATYQDAQQSAANTNPIVLDASGEAVVYLVVGQIYTFVLKDRNDVAVWTQNDVDGAAGSTILATFVSDLADGSDPNKGTALVGFRNSTVKEVLDGSAPFGPDDQHVDADGTGPMIARPWSTTADISIFVSPTLGNDNNSGDQGSPLKTITAALQRIPQNIYHKVRIYLLDGDYGREKIKLFNYFVTARGTAGFRIVGHVSSFDGESHPIYTDNKPENVQIRGYEHVFSGISGTEEMYIAGVTFTDGWVEMYDCQPTFYRCNWANGMSQPGYSTRHGLGGHNSKAIFIFCNFNNVAKVGEAVGNVSWTFEQCALTNLIMTSDAPEPGIPFSASSVSEIYLKNSPTMLQVGPGGKSNAGNGGEIYDFKYSPIGYNAIRRATPSRDESLLLLSHDGSALGSGRGAGIQLNGNSTASERGAAVVEIGSDTGATFKAQHFSSSTLVRKDLLTANFYGEVAALGPLFFGRSIRAIAPVMLDGQGGLYTDTNGDIYAVSKVGGVTKYRRISEYATATPF